MASEKRLKDVSLFEKALEKHRGLVMHNEDILAALANCPTVDAVEVVHGRWIPINTPHKWRFQCDQCNHYVDAGTDRNYCPNCGAKMVGGRENHGKGSG